MSSERSLSSRFIEGLSIFAQKNFIAKAYHGNS